MTDIAQSLSREAHAHEKELRAEHAELFGNARAWRNLAILTVALIASVWFAFYWLDFSLLRILNGLGRLGDFTLMMMPPSSGGRFSLYLWSMMETLAIAYLGTLLAAILAFPFGFLAAKNIIPNVFLHFGIRRFLDTIRGVDTLIWALIWVSVVGLGPFAGILAIACSDSAHSASCSRKPLKALTRNRWRAFSHRAGANCTAIASACCRRFCR